jgi:cell division protease FtsH
VSRFIRSALFPILIVIIVAMVIEAVIQGNSNNTNTTKPTYAGPAPSFVNDFQNDKVTAIVMNTKDQTLQVTLTGQSKPSYTVNYPDTGETSKLIATKPEVKLTTTSPKSAWWTGALTFILPFVLIIGFWIFIMNQMQGGGSKVMSFGKSKAKRVSVDSPKVSF